MNFSPNFEVKAITMKPLLLLAALTLSVAPTLAAPAHPNTTASHAKRLYFARGASTLRTRSFLGHNQHRFYVLKTRAGQHLKITAEGQEKNGVVPLIFVTPPRGEYDGDKTATYETNHSRAGDYKIEVATNLMASNARSGHFVLKVVAY